MPALALPLLADATLRSMGLMESLKVLTCRRMTGLIDVVASALRLDWRPSLRVYGLVTVWCK